MIDHLVLLSIDIASPSRAALLGKISLEQLLAIVASGGGAALLYAVRLMFRVREARLMRRLEEMAADLAERVNRYAEGVPEWTGATSNAPDKVASHYAPSEWERAHWAELGVPPISLVDPSAGQKIDPEAFAQARKAVRRRHRWLTSRAYDEASEVWRQYQSARAGELLSRYLELELALSDDPTDPERVRRAKVAIKQFIGNEVGSAPERALDRYPTSDSEGAGSRG